MLLRDNSLNTLRLIAALQVLYLHTITHLGIAGIPIAGPVLNFFRGVPIFFALSGFLIWQSIERSAGFAQYAKKRFLRLYPELWIAVAVELAVIFLLYQGPYDWPQVGLFALAQGSVFQFWTPDCLRGYGCGTPNGALWTISVLVQFYLAAWFLYKALHGRKTIVWAACILASVILYLCSGTIIRHLPAIAGKLYTQTIFPYLWIFLSAMLIAEKRDRLLPLLKKFSPLFILGSIAFSFVPADIHSGHYPLMHTLLQIPGLIGAAYALPQLNIKKDISYGIYIYHMTAVNALIALGFSGRAWLLAAVTASSALAAILSGNLAAGLRKTPQPPAAKGHKD